MAADAYHRRTTFAPASGHSPRRPPLTRGHPNRQQPGPPLSTLGGQFHRQASPAGECLLQADASRRWIPSSGRHLLPSPIAGDFVMVPATTPLIPKCMDTFSGPKNVVFSEVQLKLHLSKKSKSNIKTDCCLSFQDPTTKSSPAGADLGVYNT